MKWQAFLNQSKNLKNAHQEWNGITAEIKLYRIKIKFFKF